MIQDTVQDAVKIYLFMKIPSIANTLQIYEMSITF